MRSILLDRVHDHVMAADAERYGAVVYRWGRQRGDVGPARVASAQRGGAATAVAAEAADQGPGVPRRAPIGSSHRHQLRRPPARAAAGGEHSRQVSHRDSRGFEGVFRAKPVWSHYTTVGSISCGAELSEANPQTVAQWRQLVDSIHGGAGGPLKP